MKGFLIILVFWIVFATSCDPCDNCGEPLLYEPTVALVFINNDTLEKLNAELEYFSDSLDRVEQKESNASDQLDSLESRLIVVNDSIENGNNSYQEERDDLEALIIVYIDLIDDYADIINDTDSIIDYYTDHISDVNDGLLLIDTLFINGQYLTYEDSFETYDAPLLMNEESFTHFEVVIKGFRGEITFDYDLEESVDATREIKLRAFNIQPVSSFGFDSIGDPICVTTQCRDGETTLYLYFD